MIIGKIKNFIREYSLSIISIIILLIFWELAIHLFHTPNYILPPPSSIFIRLIESHNLLLYHTGVTLKEVLAGFILGSFFAFIISIGMSNSKILDRFLSPLIVITQTFPKEALAPLFVVWLGFGILPKIVMAAVICFFPMTVNIYKGLKSVDPIAMDLMRSLSANRWQIFCKLRFPSALPYIFAAMKVSVTLSVVGAIIGEFIGASEGLGHLIMIANSEMQVDLLFAALFIIGMIGILLFYLIELLEKHFLSWHDSMIEVSLR